MQELPEDIQRAIGKLRAREASMRDAAHFAGVRHRAGPFRLRQMLPLDALLLYACGNPVFAGRPALRCTLSEIGAFLLVLCPRARAGDQPSRLWQGYIAARLLLLRAGRVRKWIRFCARLDKYVEESFVDWPQGSGAAGPAPSPAVRSSFLSSTIDLIASRYHWPRSEIYATPFRELLLYRKHILADLSREKKSNPVPEISRQELILKDRWLRAVEATEGRN